MSQDCSRLANEAWEALLRAEVALARTFSAEDIWHELSTTEYDVLYTVSRAEGGLRIADINREVLLTQAGVSRLVARLEHRGLIARHADAADRRATRIIVTAAGTAAQNAVGLRHARSVADAMTCALNNDELEHLRRLCRRILASLDATQPATTSKQPKR